MADADDNADVASVIGKVIESDDDESVDEDMKVSALAQHDGAKVTRCSDLDTTGSIYEGPVVPFQDGELLAHGKGKLTGKGHSFVYEGDFAQGTRHGRGRFVNADGDVYEGDLQHDAPDGQGKLTFKAGGYCEGEWGAGLLNGQAKCVKADGVTYEGHFLQDKMHGTGKKYDANGVLLFDGYWKHGNESEPPLKRLVKHFKYADRLQSEEVDGRHLLMTKENETFAQIAKELAHGCTVEELMDFNALNRPEKPRLGAGGAGKTDKFRKNVEVWLPSLLCHAYLADARAARAEEEAKAKVAAAQADANAARAEAAKAKAKLDDDFKSKQQHEAKLMAQLVEMRADPDLADTIPTLEAKLSKKHEELTRRSDQKRKLRDALAEDTAAAEEEQAAKQRRRATQTALAAAWRASVQ